MQFHATINYPVRLRAEMYERIVKAADREGMSNAEWIRLAIREKLDRDVHER